MEHNDEISLVDLILIFIKRKYYFLAGLVFSLIVSSVFIYRLNSVDTYVSVLRLSKIDNESASNAESLIADLDTTFYYRMISFPDMKRLIGQTNYSSPKKSAVIKIETSGTNREEIKDFHKKVLDYLIDQDNENFAKKIELSRNKLSSLQSLISKTNNLKKIDKERFEAEIKELEFLVNSGKQNVLLLDTESKKKIDGGNSQKFIFVSVVLSFFFGVFIALLSEGVHVIRIRVNDELNKLSLSQEG